MLMDVFASEQYNHIFSF